MSVEASISAALTLAGSLAAGELGRLEALPPPDAELLAATLAAVAAAVFDAEAPEPARRQSSATYALQWARCALHYDRSCRMAQLYEAKALDRLGKRLGLAVSSYERLASKADDEAGEAASDAVCAEAMRALHSGVSPSLQPDSSVVSRYHRGVAAVTSPDDVAAAVKGKGSSPVHLVRGVGAKVYEQLPGGKETPVREAVQVLRAAADGQRPSPKLNLLERFLEEVDDLPEAVPAGQPANSVLLQLLRAGQQPGRGGGLRLLSWNCKMMNTTDLRDWEWVRAIEEKTARLAALAATEATDLLCVQECPGAQLRGPRASGKARAVAREERFARRLRESCDDAAAAARRFEVGSVAVHQYVRDEVTGEEEDVGEDHVFCWDTAALALLAPPSELPVAEADAARGAAFHRAPSRAVFRVLRPGPLCGARLVVVQAHLKSGGGELTRENVRLMGGALAALRREQCAAAAALVARISVLDDQSVRLTTSLTTPLLAARGGSAHEIETFHAEQPGLGQAWLLALGDFNLDPAQVLDEVRAAGLHGFGRGLCGQAATNMWRFCGQGDERRDGHAYDGLLYWASGGGGADQVEAAAGDAVGGSTGDATGGTAGDDTGGAAGGTAGGAAASRVFARVLEISEIDEAYDEMRSFAAALAAAAPALRTPIGLRVSPPVPTSGADAPADGVPRWLRVRYREELAKVWSDHMPLAIVVHGGT